jgi:2-(1,2-epoxy-1,2-dihydrophenyl)acetyl-CoA isomerase
MFSIADEGLIRWLTIENPGRRNAIPFSEWEALAACFEDFERSDQRALVVVGAGEHFCSGADLGADFDMTSGAAGAYAHMLRVAKAVRALYSLTKPTVAAVDGVAVGAGMNLALGCDLAIATTRARFSEIFVRRGLVVDFGGTWLLPRRVGLARAKELALTGRVIGAEEALRFGVVTELVAPEDLRRRAGEVAAELAAVAPRAQHLVKIGLERSFEMSFEEALEFESQAQSLCLSSEDVVEGVQAFMEKRPPQFKGR